MAESESDDSVAAAVRRCCRLLVMELAHPSRSERQASVVFVRSWSMFTSSVAR